MAKQILETERAERKKNQVRNMEIALLGVR